MVRAIDIGPRGLWLDPCMGPGVFIACLKDQGIQKDKIVGIDIDPNTGAEDASATAVRGVDFFQWCASTTQKFDRIVANPPYVAIRRLHPELKQSLKPFETANDASFSARSNYWCAFLSASMRVLANQGCLAFVLPAAWDYAHYASLGKAVDHLPGRVLIVIADRGIRENLHQPCRRVALAILCRHFDDRLHKTKNGILYPLTTLMGELIAVRLLIDGSERRHAQSSTWNVTLCQRRCYVPTAPICYVPGIAPATLR